MDVDAVAGNDGLTSPEFVANLTLWSLESPLHSACRRGERIEFAVVGADKNSLLTRVEGRFRVNHVLCVQAPEGLSVAGIQSVDGAVVDVGGSISSREEDCVLKREKMTM